MSITTRAPGARATVPRPAPFAARTCREVEAQLVARNRRAGAVILNAMRGWMAVGPYACVDERRGVDGLRQVAIVSVPTRAGADRYALIETDYFGFDWDFASIPACPEVTVLLWTVDREAAHDAATARVLALRAAAAAVPAPPPTPVEQARAIVEYVVAQVEALRTEEYSDVSGFVAEAVEALRPLLVPAVAR